ncbi:hypothetical protein RHGRI_030250 [Rhododendron griersonianum]|uniref:Uncharacterized protein n=1 Tax=Rhododendron griersonianum TaxID=479676 RepID=A0AAV6IMD1_9ERIC|nr:hypothetical protein RHGRI_030250 [Rhododendron griersonianum]
MAKDNSYMSHWLDSIIEDSEGLMHERSQANNEVLSKETRAENKTTEENKSAEEENNNIIQREPIFLFGPVVIGSKEQMACISIGRNKLTSGA